MEFSLTAVFLFIEWLVFTGRQYGLLNKAQSEAWQVELGLNLGPALCKVYKFGHIF